MENSSLYLTSVAGLQNGAAVVGCHLVAEGLAPTITRFAQCPVFIGGY